MCRGKQGGGVKLPCNFRRHGNFAQNYGFLNRSFTNSRSQQSLEKEWSLYPDIIQLKKVMLLLPATSAQAERSLLLTRRINSLSVLAHHKDVVND